jgi:hypothetical protein
MEAAVVEHDGMRTLWKTGNLRVVQNILGRTDITITAKFYTGGPRWKRPCRSLVIALVLFSSAGLPRPTLRRVVKVHV